VDKNIPSDRNTLVSLTKRKQKIPKVKSQIPNADVINIGLLTNLKKNNPIRLSPQASVTTVWKTPICKHDVCKQGILECPVSYGLNFRGWIKLIYDKST